MRRRRPYRSVRRRPVGANCDCLNIFGRTRDLVRCNTASAAQSAGDSAEEVALGAVSGHSNAEIVLIAN